MANRIPVHKSNTRTTVQYYLATISVSIIIILLFLNNLKTIQLCVQLLRSAEWTCLATSWSMAACDRVHCGRCATKVVWYGNNGRAQVICILFNVCTIVLKWFILQAINDPAEEHTIDDMDQYGMDGNYDRLLDRSTNFSYIEFLRMLGLNSGFYLSPTSGSTYSPKVPTFKQLHANIEPNLNDAPKNWITNEDQLNVLIFGLESMSRSNFIRNLPLTHKVNQ